MDFSRMAWVALAGAVAISAVPMVGVAATVSESIFFDDAANNGLSSFTTATGDYFLTPTNFQSSSQCADPVLGPSANGRCLIEDRQGIVTTLTRIDGSAFTLESFYFLLTGNGSGRENAITVTGSNAIGSTFYLGGLFGNVSFENGGAAGALVKDEGYVADFLASPFDIFKGVTSITWTAAASAQIRLDDINVSYEMPDVSPVPLPAGGGLLLIGLGGLMALRRFKRV